MISSARRLALKILSYGVMHLAVAVLVALAVTRDWRLALAVGVVEPFFQTVAYGLHDRVWHRIERRARRSAAEETAEAVGARLDLMDEQEQALSLRGAVRGHGHSHALPRSIRRIAAKTASYAAMHFAVAVAVAFGLTGDLAIALAIGTIEPLVQTVFFTAHDRLWSALEVRRAERRLLAA